MDGKPKKALILQGGTMRGAFFVGALKKINELLDLNYFDAIFSSSVGIFEQAFFVANQPEIMENTWREYVHGDQLINFLNPLKGKPILDLDYLIELFKSDRSFFDLTKFTKSYPSVFTLLADYKTHELKVVNLKTGKDIFQIMKAACAIPFLYPMPVLIGGRRYIDSMVAPKNQYRKTLSEALAGYDVKVAITAYGVDDKRLPSGLQLITPSKMPLYHKLDTNRRRILETIKQGELDTEKFILKHNLAS